MKSEPLLPRRCPDCRALYTLVGMVLDYGTPIESRVLTCTNCEFERVVLNSASESDLEHMALMWHPDVLEP